MLFFRKNAAPTLKNGTRNSNAYQYEMTQSKSKEISAQKLCAGTVSQMTTPKAGGLYKGIRTMRCEACVAAKNQLAELLIASCYQLVCRIQHKASIMP
jgi:hypothetical protein